MTWRLTRLLAVLAAAAVIGLGEALPAAALPDADVGVGSANLSTDYWKLDIFGTTGRAYNGTMEFGIDDQTGVGASYNRLRSGTDTVTLADFYGRYKMTRDWQTGPTLTAIGGLKVRHVTGFDSQGNPINDSLTGWMLGLTFKAPFGSRLAARGRFDVAGYPDQEFFEAEVGLGLRLGSTTELQLGYRNQTRSGADTIDGGFLGIGFVFGGTRGPVGW